MLRLPDILTATPPPADARLPYGPDRLHFADLRLPRTKPPHPLAMMIHGGFWRNRYDLAHAGHLCAALTARGIATWNIEYRRVGDPGGGWPGTFEDVTNAWRFIRQRAADHKLDPQRMLVMGHSAGGQLALCLAGHQREITSVVSLAGVVDLKRAWDLHLSHDAVAEFLGGNPQQVPEHYREASPAELAVTGAAQVLIHGRQDDTVPFDMSRDYVERKLSRGENVRLVDIADAGHFDLIDPHSHAWKRVDESVAALFHL